jgi:hypothetical protein
MRASKVDGHERCDVCLLDGKWAAAATRLAAEKLKEMTSAFTDK